MPVEILDLPPPLILRATRMSVSEVLRRMTAWRILELDFMGFSLGFGFFHRNFRGSGVARDKSRFKGNKVQIESFHFRKLFDVLAAFGQGCLGVRNDLGTFDER